MATFQVPQFVEQKAKIVGSLTLFQFGYVAVGGLLIYGLYYVFNLFVWVLISIPIAGVAAFLAFAKINGQDSHKILGAVFGYLIGSRTYVWRRETPETVLKIGGEDKIQKIRSIMGVQERIKSIALHVTTGRIFQGKEGEKEKGGEAKEGYEVATFETGEKKLVKRIDY